MLIRGSILFRNHISGFIQDLFRIYSGFSWDQDIMGVVPGNWFNISLQEVPTWAFKSLTMCKSQRQISLSCLHVSVSTPWATWLNLAILYDYGENSHGPRPWTHALISSNLKLSKTCLGVLKRAINKSEVWKYHQGSPVSHAPKLRKNTSFGIETRTPVHGSIF